ncbi:lipopolysaccharide biosynthesis protein [Mariluticola halotolerans]|uniref:lipopolysaccharide biosynthesis protein n=1 Tax=Mariluticola halotolerans TaxID=2909283 RepID=UPI0026E1D91E|nr:polysaccharide biosynthesis C-terminal domain-containing protein [Mariluticola halotolerans]UJQ95459.1 polysaccharide biosynthesis C-terminal domain-containing protein [Mariluticola halotolerans]
MKLGRRLLSQSAVIFAARILGAGLIFLAQAAIARLWGAEILGEYLLIIAASNLVAVVLPLGFHTIGTYFAAEYSARNDRRMLEAFLRRSYGHILLVGVPLIILAAPVAGLFGVAGHQIAALAMPAALMAVATAVIFNNTAFLVGLRRPFAGFFAEIVFRPLLIIGAFIIAAAFFTEGTRLAVFLWLFAVAYLAIALVQFWLVLRATRQITDTIPVRAPDSARWWRFAAPWVLISLATEFFFDIDLLVLSMHLSREDLAIFGICARIFALISFGVASVYAVTIPDIFEAEARNDRSGFHHRIGEANLVASLIAIILSAGVFIGGPLVLSIFGPEFAAGAWPLGILSLGLVVRAVFGPATMVLSIYDQPYASLPAVGAGLLSLIGLNYLLVPSFGLMGASFAALLAIVIWSAGLWLTAWRLAGVDVSIVARLRVLHQAKAQAAVSSDA